MQIYKYYNSNKELIEYTSDDVLEDKPCYILGCGLIYPLRVKEYRDFINKYASYFTFSETGLNQQFPIIKNYDNFIDKIITYNSFLKIMLFQDKANDEETQNKSVKMVFDELEKALA